MTGANPLLTSLLFNESGLSYAATGNTMVGNSPLKVAVREGVPAKVGQGKPDLVTIVDGDIGGAGGNGDAGPA